MLDWIYEHARVRAWFLLAAALGLLSMFVAPPAEAGTITTIGKAPTLYTDGTKIDKPISYRLEGNYDGQPTITVTADVPNFKLVSMPAGRWCNRMYAVVDNVDAEPSELVCVTVPGPAEPPQPAKKKPNPTYGVATTAAP
jgi:hypothetical protein